jgi:integrase
VLSPLPGVGPPPEPDDFVLYAVKPLGRARCSGATPSGASVQYVHRWWYRQLEAAGLVGEGVRSGLNMHRARHTFATELRRVAGIDAASHALGHSDLSTTLGIDGHRELGDLERDMEASPGGSEMRASESSR